MTPWGDFFKEKTTKIFTEKNRVIDIGGGLRVLKGKGNRYNPNREWLRPYLEKVTYEILDPVPDYEPDIIGDIHALPLEDNSVDALICIAVLEHIENPHQAVAEMKRVLKPGGYAFVYVPFLYYYHAEVGYYKDYWRYSRDAVEMLFKDFSNLEIQSVRGAIGTWIRISPLGRFKWLEKMAYWADIFFGKLNSKQVSGFNIFVTK